MSLDLVIAVNVPAGTSEPVSERIDLVGLHKINGRSAVRHTEPWSVIRVGLRGWGASQREELGSLVETTRTRTGAVRAANKLARTTQGSARTTAYIVQCDDMEYVWHRAEVTA